MNNPNRFKVQRLKEGEDKSADKQYLPMRKGVADASLRAKVLASCNKRFSEQLDTPVLLLISQYISLKIQIANQ